MNPRHLRWPFVVLLCAGVSAPISGSTSIGVSAEWVDGRYRFAVGSDPVALVFSGVLAAAYGLLMCSATNEGAGPVPGLVRRFATFWIDFVWAILISSPLVGVGAVVAEWKATHRFAWSFERTTQEANDWLLASVSLLITAGLMVCYFAIPLVRRRPSPGSCILGYQVLPDPGTSLSFGRAVLRTLTGFVALSAAWLAPFVGRKHDEGKFWLDRVFHTHASMLK